jgi:hypothetical protein
MIFKYCGECCCCINYYNLEKNFEKKNKIEYCISILNNFEKENNNVYDDEFFYSCTGTIGWNTLGSTTGFIESVTSYFISNYGRLLYIYGPYGFNGASFEINILDIPEVRNPIKINQFILNILNNLLESDNILLQSNNYNITYNKKIIEKIIINYNNYKIKERLEINNDVTITQEQTDEKLEYLLKNSNNYVSINNLPISLYERRVTERSAVFLRKRASKIMNRINELENNI